MSGSEQDDRNLMVIDTDCGTDDALAILLALSFKKTWKVLAITCCFGNTSVDNACNNSMRVLHLCNELEIPVYRGCERPLVAECSPRTVHGDDGLGNVASEFPTGELKVSEGHAAEILSKLAQKYPKQINLVALGPLTNIAIAHRLDPDFTKNLKSLYFMGGNIQGIGNTTPAAEFNFCCDPESAHIVVTEALCPVTMVPWETTVEHGMAWDWFEDLLETKSKKAYFIKKTTNVIRDFCKRMERNDSFPDCDFLAVAAVVHPSSISETMNCPIYVETFGNFTRGQVVVDRIYHLRSQKDHDHVTSNVINIVTRFHDTELYDLRKRIVVDDDCLQNGQFA